MKELNSITFRNTLDYCYGIPRFSVGVFCTTETIAREAFTRGCDAIDKEAEKEEKKPKTTFNKKNMTIKFKNGSYIQYIYKAREFGELKFDEVMYHSLLSLQRYGDTLRFLRLIENKRD